MSVSVFVFLFQKRCQLNTEQYHTPSREQLRAVKVEQCSNNRMNWNQIKTVLVQYDKNTAGDN